jgi:hypothetical protein
MFATDTLPLPLSAVALSLQKSCCLPGTFITAGSPIIIGHRYCAGSAGIGGSGRHYPDKESNAPAY